MKASNFETVYVGLGVGSSYGKHRNVEAELNLIKELNNHTKFSLGTLRGHCNVAGFNQIASPTCTATRSVSTLHGATRGSGPGEYTTVDVLRERDVDAAFVRDFLIHSGRLKTWRQPDKYGYYCVGVMSSRAHSAPLSGVIAPRLLCAPSQNRT